MASFRLLAARGGQSLHGPAWRGKVLANNCEDPDDADEIDEFDEFGNSDDFEDFLMTFAFLVQAVKGGRDSDFRGSGRGPKVANTFRRLF